MFTSKKAYVDTYTSFHYVNFITLYHSDYVDLTTMRKCSHARVDNNTNSLAGLIKGHLRVLLAISRQKNEDVILKFYQLRVVDFFTREIDVEQKIAHIKMRRGMVRFVR